MPRKKKVVKVLKDINKLLRKHKIISKGSRIVAKVAPKKYKSSINKAGDVAKLLGYGRGGGLRLAGRGRKKVVRKRRVGRPCKK